MAGEPVRKAVAATRNFIYGLRDDDRVQVYAFNNEHSPNYPLYKGEKIYCINATTGEEIYRMLSWAGQTGGAGTARG